MHAIRIDRPGGYERLRYVELSSPEPRPHEVLVETRAVGVNFADCVVRLGLYPSAKEFVGWPITPGFEFSGVVTRVGAEVQEFSVGDEVLGITLFGGYATHIVVPALQLRKKPAALTFEEAAGIPVALLTAWYTLVELGAGKTQVTHAAGAPPRGKRVLVHSAAGGVGGALVAMAKHLGCEVIGVVGSSHKVEMVRALGADHVIDKSRESLAGRLREYGPTGYDIVLDANGAETLKQSYQVLRPTGRLVIYGAHTMLRRGFGGRNWFGLLFALLRTPRFDPLRLTNDNKSVLACNLSYLVGEQALLARGLDEVLGWVAGGHLPAPQVQNFPLREAARAHAALQSGTTVGKLILTTVP